jgi:BirA family transcriptional regulator, biotin operon repressor / biotin---[acetyl-CoA-carboxylase] ligase
MDVVILTSLFTGLPVPQIRCFDSIGSTNDEALAWITAGANDGCLVAAEQQTLGRGRLNRRWITRPGAALAFSVILLPAPEEIEHLGFFSPLGALAISQALENLHGLAPLIKWPNDVLLEGHKVAGILLEVAWLGDQIQGMVIGIGLNVTAAAVPPANELLFPATSVEEAAGHSIDRLVLLREIVRCLFEWRSKLMKPEFHQAWEQRLAFKDQWVRIEGTHQQPIIGQVLGIDRSGELLLRGSAGDTIKVTVGDVHLRLMD